MGGTGRGWYKPSRGLGAIERAATGAADAAEFDAQANGWVSVWGRAEISRNGAPMNA